MYHACVKQQERVEDEDKRPASELDREAILAVEGKFVAMSEFQMARVWRSDAAGAKPGLVEHLWRSSLVNNEKAMTFEIEGRQKRLGRSGSVLCRDGV